MMVKVNAAGIKGEEKADLWLAQGGIPWLMVAMGTMEAGAQLHLMLINRWPSSF
jgi:hypothetical protein